MDSLTHKSYKTSRSFTYSYYVKLSTTSKPNLLFVHGFPDSAHLWTAQIAHFSALGYGCVAPDCLGYGGTDKPTDPEAYNGEGMAADVVEILDAEDVKKVILTGHDWGCFLIGRIAIWHPKRVMGSIFLDVAYNPPAPMDLDAFLAMVKQQFGFEAFSYWKFFSSQEAASIVEDHLESFFTVLYPRDESQFKHLFGNQEEMQEFIKADKKQPTQDWATDEMRAKFIERFKRDGFTGPFNSYKAIVFNHHWNHDKNLPESRHHLPDPTLYIGATRDPLSPPAVVARMKPYCKDLSIDEVDTQHWLMLERPDELNQKVEKWLKEKFGSSSSNI